MLDLIIILIIVALMLSSSYISVPDEHITVGQRGDVNIVTTAFHMDRLTEASASIPKKKQELDSDGFSLITWNMLKGMKDGWKEDLQRLSSDVDLLVLQEAYLTDELRELLQTQRYNWDLTTAFEYKNIESGVLTASKIEPDFLCSFRFEEPLITIPKSILITRYPLSDTDQLLLVANVHSINFTVGTSKFRAQLQQFEELASKHPGPLVMAGDFNTWSKERMAIVDSVAENLNLQAVNFDENKRVTIFGHNVDHIYFRGLEPCEAVVSPVTTSDHNPMRVTFRLATDKDVRRPGIEPQRIQDRSPSVIPL
jgi:endonuclease/exonuclease/phosphatase (EEP) superfamily protein YafD